jgi:hypothetical protein
MSAGTRDRLNHKIYLNIVIDLKCLGLWGPQNYYYYYYYYYTAL